MIVSCIIVSCIKILYVAIEMTVIECEQWCVLMCLSVSCGRIVKGAHEGAGLGNKFLTNIRQTDAIVHVVRCFEDTNIIHVDETVDPLRDVEVINLELILADIAQVEKRMAKVKKDAKLKKQDAHEMSALEKVLITSVVQKS
jgi:ribosome-binding ATPase YchF (GTP1/OBG family)